MSRSAYISASKRLAELPEVFTGSDLTVLFGWTSAVCSTYLANWRKAGLIQPLGGRSDVHMNLVRNRQCNPLAALRRAFPRAVLLGVDRLREAGWTTQIPTRLEVALPVGSPRYSLPGFDLSTRSDKWFDRVAPGLDRSPNGIDSLRPAWALADMLARAHDKRIRTAWLLAPDDLDLASARRDKSVAAALQAFDLPAESLEDAVYLARYRVPKPMATTRITQSSKARPTSVPERS